MNSLLFAPAAELADLQHKLWFILIIFTMQSQITKLLRLEVLDQKKTTVQPIFPVPMLYTPGCKGFPIGYVHIKKTTPARAGLLQLNSRMICV
jgi:hypothetical protein